MHCILLLILFLLLERSRSCSALHCIWARARAGGTDTGTVQVDRGLPPDLGNDEMPNRALLNSACDGRYTVHSTLEWYTVAVRVPRLRLRLRTLGVHANVAVYLDAYIQHCPT